MLKKSSLVALLAVMLCVATLFTSCGDKLPDVSKLFNTEYDPDPQFLSDIKELGSAKNYVLKDSTFVLSLLQVTNSEDKVTPMVVNTRTGEVKSFSEKDDVSLEHYFGYFYVVKTADEKDDQKITYTLYNGMNMNDAAIKTSDKDFDIDRTEMWDTILIDGDVYVMDMDNYSVKLAYEFPVGKTYPEKIQLKSGDYYYYVDENNSMIFAYDKEFNNVAFWDEADQNFVDGSFKVAPLTGGKVMIQYAVSLPDDAEKYDVALYGERFNFFTFLWDVKSGKVTEDKKCDFVINEFIPDPSVYYPGVNKKLENVAIVTMIEDKTFKGTNSAKRVTLTQKGAIDEDLSLVEGQKTETLEINVIEKDLYQIKMKSGEILWLNGKGETRATFSANYFSSGAGQKSGTYFYDVKTDSFYDLDKNLIVKVGENDRVFDKGYDYIIIYNETTVGKDAEAKTTYTWTRYKAGAKAEVIASYTDGDNVTYSVSNVPQIDQLICVTKYEQGSTTATVSFANGSKELGDYNKIDFLGKSLFTVENGDGSLTLKMVVGATSFVS